MTDPSQPFSAQPHSEEIETVYVTVTSQGESTDWLTVVRNLRQGNRKLLEQVEELEMTIAALKSESQSHQERSQMQGIKIIQQDDDLKIAQEQAANLFEQLENSHRISQRQQIMVETLSQKLEIAQSVVNEMETENQQLKQQQQEDAKKLSKAEAVAQELYRRLKQLQGQDLTVAESVSNDAEDAFTPAPPLPSPSHNSDDHQEVNNSLSGPLKFEVEFVPPGWPVPAVQSAAELKATPPTSIDLPKFQKRPAQN
jgi:NADH dehydrogenase/NADH:ubiquinone oxidoreductase subunit G